MIEDFDRLLGQSSVPDGLRIAFVGIGNELNGDDAAGVLVARALIAHLRRGREDDHPATGETEKRGRVLAIDAGPAPESFTGPLRRFAPDLVVLIDAAEMGEPPGGMRVFDWPEAEGMSASTHSMPPSMLARYLANEVGCRVVLVGIQPAGLDFDAPVSKDVHQAVEVLTARFIAMID